MSMRCKYMNPTKTRIQKHQPHWNGSGYTLSAPWRGSPKDLPAGWRDKPENVGAASRRNKSKCVLLIIRNFPPNRHGHTMTQKSVSHTEQQGPSCSLQKTRLQEQKNIYMYLRTDIHSHCIIWFNVNTSPAVWMSLDARSIDQTRSQTNAPPQPDARYVVSSKQADGVFVMVDIRAETGSLESGGYRSGMYMYVSGVLKECEAFFKEERFFADPDHQKTPLAATGVAKNLGHPMAPFLYTVSLQLVTTERGDWWCLRCRVLSCFNLGSLSLSSVMGRIVLLRVYLEHRRSEVAIVSNQVSHRNFDQLNLMHLPHLQNPT